MSEQGELSKELQDMLIKYLSECLVGGAVPLELAEIRARDFVAKAKQHYKKQATDIIKGIEEMYEKDEANVIEEAKKQERERIQALYENMGCVPEEDNCWYRFWQALKEEK